MKSLFQLFFLVITFNVIGQSNSEKKSFSIPLGATVNVAEIKEDWKPLLQNIEAPAPGIHTTKAKLNAIKDSLQKVYPKKYASTTSRENKTPLPLPFIGKSFQGNVYNFATPNDNDIAISDSNKIISVQNVSVFSYDVNTNKMLSSMSLNSFGAALNNPNGKFDPKVVYDPINDKYILLYLNGYTDTTSSITVGFSQTNNPIGNWNLYEIPGNPLNNGLWTDFPMIAITDKEAFITVNLLYPDSSWQTGFNETIIWQVNKASGYTGGTLSTLLHSNIKTNGKNLRNLCPVKGGSGLKGPDMYFLSNRNFSPQNDSIFLVHINDTIAAPGQTLTAIPLISNHSYFVPPNAEQPGAGVQEIATNDARVLGAFIENDIIQFVSNTLDTATGHASVYYGKINNVSSNPTVTGTILTDSVLEFGYANISYIGSGVNNNTAVLNFNHSAKTVNPGVSALITDANGNYSPVVTLKSGLGFFNIIGGTDRWGDYSGSQRKYNDTGKVWVNGMWANISNKNTTWISELSLNSLTGINVNAQNNYANNVTLYPNPANDIIIVDFELSKSDYLIFEIVDLNGKMIKQLMREKVKEGKNSFSFSSAPLSNGIYFLKISSETNQYTLQKFIKN